MYEVGKISVNWKAW